MNGSLRSRTRHALHQFGHGSIWLEHEHHETAYLIGR